MLDCFIVHYSQPAAGPWITEAGHHYMYIYSIALLVQVFEDIQTKQLISQPVSRNIYYEKTNNVVFLLVFEQV